MNKGLVKDFKLAHQRIKSEQFTFICHALETPSAKID